MTKVQHSKHINFKGPIEISEYLWESKGTLVLQYFKSSTRDRDIRFPGQRTILCPSHVQYILYHTSEGEQHHYYMKY
jgi:hypothetical protein